jgi:hypothetical protein
MKKWTIYLTLFLCVTFLGTTLSAQTPEPRQPTGVEDTCDDMFKECMKMCANDPQDEIPPEECTYECKLDNDQCYRLP